MLRAWLGFSLLLESTRSVNLDSLVTLLEIFPLSAYITTTMLCLLNVLAPSLQILLPTRLRASSIDSFVFWSSCFWMVGNLTRAKCCLTRRPLQHFFKQEVCTMQKIRLSKWRESKTWWFIMPHSFMLQEFKVLRQIKSIMWCNKY